MTSAEVAKQVRRFESALKAHATPERAEFEKRYHKSSLRFIGANAASISRECAVFCKAHKDLSRNDIDSMADALWRTDCHELRSIAIGITERFRNLFGVEDLGRLRQWMIDSAGWAHVDTISVHIVGDIFVRDPKTASVLRKWSKDSDFWVRRASMLALLNAARHGDRAAFELFSKLAESMIVEKEFFIRKAIGWVLREVSKKQPDWVVGFFEQNAPKASGLTFREGSKYLPEKDQARLQAIR